MSTWPGRSSALGGLEMEFSGIGGVWPRSSAARLRHSASRKTDVLYTSLMGPYAPTESPYSVEYPTASSDLLPGASTMWPSWLEIAINSVPRSRDWRFSSARPVSSVDDM